jgi:carbon monoxide dehydrogenase subunit G
MKLEQSFEVDAPLERAWQTLVDVERVAPCLPGAELTEVDADGVYHGSFTVKLGAATAAYRGELRIDALDDSSHTATMQASGTDKRGQGGAKATIVSMVSEREGGGARVELVTDFTITGRLAQFGRGGMIEDVSNRLLREFADCLRSRLEGPDDAEHAQRDAHPADSRPARPIKGFSLFWWALWKRIKRLFRPGQ